MIEQEIQSVLWETKDLPYSEKFEKLMTLFRRVGAILLPLFPDEGTHGFECRPKHSSGYEYGLQDGAGSGVHRDGSGYGFGEGYGGTHMHTSGYGGASSYGDGYGDGSKYGDGDAYGDGFGFESAYGHGSGYESGWGEEVKDD